MSTVPMFAPDGSLGDIPTERMQDALKAGAKPAVQIQAPDGTRGYVPASRMMDATKAGGKLIPIAEQETQHPGFWSAAMGDLAQTSKALAPLVAGPAGLAYQNAKQAFETRKTLQQTGQTPSQIQNQGEQQAGYGPIYRHAIAPAAAAVGVNVPGMEQSAAEGDTAGVLGHTVVPAAAAVAPAVAEGVLKGAGAVLPSKVRAGAALQDIKTTVGDVPINTAKVGDSALELYTQSQRGATLPPAVNKLVRRLAAPDSAPMTYAEAKDFQSNISSLSANEKMNLKPNQVRLVGQLNADLKASLADAADTVGKGEQFTNAMKEYHNAMKLKGYSDAAIDAAWKAAIGAAGVYGAAKVFGVATHAPGQ